MTLTKRKWRVVTGAASAAVGGLVLYSARHWSPYTTCAIGFLCWLFGYFDGVVDNTLHVRENSHNANSSRTTHQRGA
jgi:uncharacterized membrane protein HdeD (DUF308 family)